MSWPSKIFLESTVLFQLGPRLENVEIAELVRLRDYLDFELAVAEVSWREYLRRREKEVQDCLAKLRQCKSELVKHGQSVADLEQAEQNVLGYVDVIGDGFLQKATNLKIAVVPTPPLDIRQLMEMSLGRIPPFEDSQSDSGEKTKEKGFRDALIMFTILENAGTVPENDVLIVTRDNRLTEGFMRFSPNYNKNVELVPDLQTAVSHIYGKVDELYRRKLRLETAEAKNTLLEYRDQISQTVGQIRDLTEDDLGQGAFSRAFGGSKPEEWVNIQEIRSVKFDSVESALWKDRDKPSSRILFKIKCLAHVIGTPGASLFSWNRTTFTVGGGKQTSYVASPVESIQKDLPVTLYGEARLERTGELWHLTDLRVDKSLPDEEWKELQKVAVQLAK